MELRRMKNVIRRGSRCKMLKMLIIGADSVTPDIIFEKRELFPNLMQLMNQGVYSAYSAFVQKGFHGSYSSEQNWASLYTGLTPKQHNINTNYSRGENRRPQMRDFDDLSPFWEVLNDNGYSVGLWAADSCVNPVPIKGYVISTRYQMLNTPVDDRKSPRSIEICEKDKKIASEVLEGDPIYRLYPKTLIQQGFCYKDLQDDPELAERAILKYHFQDSINNFKEELEYWFGAMERTQERYPVDAMFFYTPTTDLIAHCSTYCDDSPTLLEAYQLLDKYIGELIDKLQPEITIFVSDHGQQNFKNIVNCTNRKIQREAFSARDEVLWLKNGYIAFEAHNGALLFTAHALRGTFIASGLGIKKNTYIDEMRTVDFYPTLLEMMKIKVPDPREGYVLDIFNRQVVNKDLLLDEKKIEKKKIAFIQCQQPSVTDIILNELYIEKRFSCITVVGEEKYREIYLNNPRVTGFVSYEEFKSDNYDEVYCGIYNQTTEEMKYMRIK